MRDIPDVLLDYSGQSVMVFVNVQILIFMTAMMVLLEMGVEYVDRGLSRNVEVNGWLLVQRAMSTDQVA